jgi:hypothetical protein
MGDMNEQVYTFRFTVSQVNEMVSLMRDAPYAKVQATINEFMRQIREQEPATAPPPPPKANGEAQPAGAASQ